MFLHDIDYDKFDIACEDTLLSPQHWDDEPFEVIVSNPPYSIKWKGDDDITLINDPRFAPAGVLAPKSKADLAFIMHSLAWLATNGIAAIVCFPGVMYRGGAEKKIRQYLIDNNYIDCIIQLPENLFFGTSIATCIMVLKKAKKDNCTLFIDATKECVKVTNNNECDVDAILTICAPEGNQALEYHYTVLDMPVVQEGETPTEPTATYSQLTTTGTFDAEVNVLTTANGLIGAGEYKIVAIAFELPGGYEMPEPEEGTTVSLTTTFDILVRGTQHATTTTTSEPDPNP